LKEVAMFARNVSIRLKPTTLNDFAQTFEKEVVPMLRKQAGFRDEIALANENGTHVTAISLWDSKEQAEAYEKTAYPGVLKGLEKYMDGAPKVHPGTVINSTLHKLAAVVAA
ncbi:MAG: antibiotic biosynthesis monooxygenase family protein, partial [Terriglobales bacterium]